MTTFFPLELKENLINGYRKVFEVKDYSMLLIHHDNQTYLIENKCGHFGYPLDKGKIEGGAIFCPQHNISFDLESGRISNRPYENADPIQVFPVIEQDGQIGVTLDD